MEEDKGWVERESEEILAEKNEYCKFLERKGEVVNEEGNRGMDWETKGEAEVEAEEQEAEEEDSEMVRDEGPTKN
jgi:hypothetical protein